MLGTQSSCLSSSSLLETGVSVNSTGGIEVIRRVANVKWVTTSQVKRSWVATSLSISFGVASILCLTIVLTLLGMLAYLTIFYYLLGTSEHLGLIPLVYSFLLTELLKKLLWLYKCMFFSTPSNIYFYNLIFWVSVT